MNNILKLSLLTSVGLCAFSVSSLAESPNAFLDDGSFFGEVRYRYETVDQDGINNDAAASTVRTNLGYKTGKYKGFSGLIEGQIVQNIGVEDFNSTTNGKTTYPVVADPNVTEINELWASYDVFEDTSVKLGRQKINIDGQRFVGTVGWRQNDQTFDGVTITDSSIDRLNASYSYIQNVNRIQGGDNPLGDLSSTIHLADASYKFSDLLKAKAYGYWMEFDEAAGLSNQTFGLRATGNAPLSEDWTFMYEAEYAMQEDHGNSVVNFDEDYYHIAPGIKGHGFTFKSGYEVLEGDGTTGFKTPLATAHKFNGWADKFLATPANGLEDVYAMVGYKASGTDSMFDGTTFKAFYHDFSGEESGDYGSEVDLAVSKTFTLPDVGQPFKNVGVTLKYSDYSAEDAPYTDTQKFWLQVGTKF